MITFLFTQMVNGMEMACAVDFNGDHSFFLCVAYMYSDYLCLSESKTVAQ